MGPVAEPLDLGEHAVEVDLRGARFHDDDHLEPK
jgi:hypothetical protein